MMHLAHRTRNRPILLRHHPTDRKQSPDPMQARQLRRLQALWRRWGGSLGLLPEADQQLRHYYIQLITQGRANTTRDLNGTDADQVIQWLRERLRHAEVAQNYAAGTAGRRGYPEHPKVQPGVAAWSALWGCAQALGMERPALERFIRRHYSGLGLRSLSDLRTMADLNRVLWGLKAIARRRRDNSRSSHVEEKRAA
jgi:hypothetical protein